MIAKVPYSRSQPSSEVTAGASPRPDVEAVRRSGEAAESELDEARPHNPRPASRVWIALLLLTGVGATWFFRDTWLPYFSKLEAKQPAKSNARVIPVTTATAKHRDLELYLNGLGTVTALKTVTMRSRVDGEITKVAFREGQLVREGDLLAEIDPRPFEVQRDQAAGQLARDEATLQVAKLNLERLQRLAKSNAASKQELDNQEALVQQTEGIIKSDRALVADAELQLTYCRIISPIDGRIGLRLVDEGNIVRANDATGLAVITQLKPIAIIFTISQDDIPRVQRRFHEAGELRVDAYDRGFETKLATGRLLATDNQVDPMTGTLRLKAVVDEDEIRLFPNQFVNTRLLVDIKKNAVVVPSAAVQRGPNTTFVYVVRADETVELRSVVIGPSEGSEISIESGLEPGETVVTDGIDKLQPGAKISTRQSGRKAESASKDSSEPAVERATEAGASDRATAQ